MDTTSSGSANPPTATGDLFGLGASGLAGADPIFGFLASITSINSWLQIVVIGGALEGVRRVASSVWERILTAFFLTASFEENEACHDWLETWLMKQPSWSKPRKLDVYIRKKGDLGFSVFEDHNESSRAGPEKVRYQPSMGQAARMWYKGSLLTVMRNTVEETEGGGYRFRTNSICLTMLTRSHEKLNLLLQEAHAAYKAEVENRINIRSSYDTYRGWGSSVSRPKRPLSSVVLPSTIKHRLLEDAKEFLSSEKWYSERGIPWRRGYLLHGSPGSGKTSLIYALAGELDLDIYVFSLAKRGMDDDELMNVINSLPPRSIALMEDIDAAFTRGISRDMPDAPEAGTSAVSPAPAAPGQPPPSQGITLAGLLAAIDGVAAQEGRILFATTNDRAALDLALCRPGRLDVHFEFQLANRDQAEELFKHFYPCKKREEEVGVDGEKLVAPLVDLRSNTKSLDLAELTEEEVAVLAREFGALIPEDEFSMAALQGHLMQFKKRPGDVIHATPDWITEERAAKQAWEEARRRRANAARPTPSPETPPTNNTAPTTLANSPTMRAAGDLQ